MEDAESFYTSLLASLGPSPLPLHVPHESQERAAGEQEAAEEHTAAQVGLEAWEDGRPASAAESEASGRPSKPTPAEQAPSARAESATPASLRRSRSPKSPGRDRSPSVEEIIRPPSFRPATPPSKRKSRVRESVEKSALREQNSTASAPDASVSPTAAQPVDAISSNSTDSTATVGRETVETPADGFGKRAPTPPAPLAPTTPPSTSATREAELRAKLLAAAASRKRKPPPTPARNLQPAAKKPNRGPPTVTEVPIASESASSPAAAITGIPQALDLKTVPSTPHTRTTSLSSLPGSAKLALPPKPARRAPFALVISVPFPYASHPAGKVSLQTEVLPLDTPITALLDLFGRRGESDCLWFPPLGDSSVRPEGQCFFRQQRRLGDHIAGWKPPNASIGLGLEARKSTLEDIHVPLDQCEVECDLLATPPPQASNPTGYEEDEEDSYEYDQVDGDYDASPDMEYAEDDDWDNEELGENEWVEGGEMDWDPSAADDASPNTPMPPFWPASTAGWQGPLLPFQSPHTPMGSWFPSPAFGGGGGSDPSSSADAPRWIPGHQDYESAGFAYGFGGPQGPQLMSMPSPPMPLSSRAPISMPGSGGHHSRNSSLRELELPTGGALSLLGPPTDIRDIVSPPLEAPAGLRQSVLPPKPLATIPVKYSEELGRAKKEGKKQRKQRPPKRVSGGGGGASGEKKQNKKPGGGGAKR